MDESMNKNRSRSWAVSDWKKWLDVVNCQKKHVRFQTVTQIKYISDDIWRCFSFSIGVLLVTSEKVFLTTWLILWLLQRFSPTTSPCQGSRSCAQKRIMARKAPGFRDPPVAAVDRWMIFFLTTLISKISRGSPDFLLSTKKPPMIQVSLIRRTWERLMCEISCPSLLCPFFGMS